MIDDKSDHLWNIELTKKSEFKEAFIKWLIDARRDPEYGRSDLVLVVRLDNAGEWGREFEGFHEACKDRLNPVPYFAYQGTMVDSRYNGKAEMAVRMVEEMTKAVMLTTSDEFHDLDEQTNYYNWIFTEFQLGSDKSFGKAVGGVYFPNPIRKQEQQ